MLSSIWAPTIGPATPPQLMAFHSHSKRDNHFVPITIRTWGEADASHGMTRTLGYFFHLYPVFTAVCKSNDTPQVFYE
jgi:hypothetical protein